MAARGGQRGAPTLGQAHRPADGQAVHGAGVPTRVQRDPPRQVLYVAVLGRHPGPLEGDVCGALAQCGPACKGTG